MVVVLETTIAGCACEIAVGGSNGRPKVATAHHWKGSESLITILNSVSSPYVPCYVGGQKSVF